MSLEVWYLTTGSPQLHVESEGRASSYCILGLQRETRLGAGDRARVLTALRFAHMLAILLLTCLPVSAKTPTARSRAYQLRGEAV